MIDFIKGSIEETHPERVVIETGGVGYEVHVTLMTYKSISDQKTTKLYIYEHIREDCHDLYGFFQKSERDMFEKLVSVSGIGPNTARVALSTMTPSELVQAISSEDVSAFKKIKGIGPKTAKRIILDLKDKIVAMTDVSPIGKKDPVVNESFAQAVKALKALGFSQSDAEKGVKKVSSEATEKLSVEELIRKTLQKKQ